MCNVFASGASSQMIPLRRYLQGWRQSILHSSLANDMYIGRMLNQDGRKQVCSLLTWSQKKIFSYRNHLPRWQVTFLFHYGMNSILLPGNWLRKSTNILLKLELWNIITIPLKCKMSTTLGKTLPTVCMTCSENKTKTSAKTVFREQNVSILLLAETLIVPYKWKKSNQHLRLQYT
jgi:hypothetical protein